MNKKGFTLLEVMIVVIIVGILSSVALPQYITTLEKGKSAEAVTNIGSLRTSLDRYWYQNAAGTTDIDDLDVDNPNTVTNRLYQYAITVNSCTSTARIYTMKAERIGKESEYWVQWTQTSNAAGKLTRSAKLGGPTS